MLLNAAMNRMAPQQRRIRPQMSVVLGLRNPALDCRSVINMEWVNTKLGSSRVTGSPWVNVEQ